MMSSLIAISRAGKEIGKYEEKEILTLFSEGKILPNDFYWRQGMKEWQLLSNLISELREKQKAIESDKAANQEKPKSEQLPPPVNIVTPPVNILAKKPQFVCNCCRCSFKEPFNPEADYSNRFWTFAILSFFMCIPPLFLFLPYWWVRAGLRLTAIFFKSPHCPNCESTNFSIPTLL